MTVLLALNVALFLCVAAAGGLVAWFGWELSGEDDDDPSDRGDGGSGAGPWLPVAHLPGGPVGAGPDDLPRSA